MCVTLQSKLYLTDGTGSIQLTRCQLTHKSIRVQSQSDHQNLGTELGAVRIYYQKHFFF